MEKLIRCTQCNKVIPQYNGYGDFAESSTLPGVEWSSEDLDEQREFFREHGGHPLEVILVDPETFFGDPPSFAPTRVVYLEASNGKDRFLIKRVKKGLSYPAVYELIPAGEPVGDIRSPI
jgi:hypothetical protein